MSEGLNRVTLFGNLGTDPELKHYDRGPVLKMRLATNESWFDKEQNKREERVEWHSLTMFGRRAEALAKHLHKGSKVLIQGRLVTSDYEKDGQKRYRTEVIVEELFFGDRTPQNGAFAPRPASAASVGAADLPF